MTTEYGNISWQFFVYGSYAFVAAALALYLWYVFAVRNKNLHALYDEGFLESKHED